MKEKEFINTIKSVLKSKYIGDDCAYLKDLGIVISQDNLVEDIHFKKDFTTPYKLGWKAAMVNISDICASGAEPRYLTAGLSLPEDISCGFVKEFYQGMRDAAGNVIIAGGDITGSDKIFISVCAVGSAQKRNISSRKNAKPGQKIIVSGYHGSSAAGLRELFSGKKESKFIEKHLMPVARRDFSARIAQNEKTSYAMMDTSDGLMDALSQIAQASGVMIEADFDKIPYDNDLTKYDDYINLVLFGGEDYELVAAVDDDAGFPVIGSVKEAGSDFSEGNGIVKVNFKTQSVTYSMTDIENKLYKHFKELQ